jgi:hypothetical protein
MIRDLKNREKEWGWLDSNQRIREESDLQSDAIGRYATPPSTKRENAGERNRTLNRPITNRMLCQLSYSSEESKTILKLPLFSQQRSANLCNKF